MPPHWSFFQHSSVDVFTCESPSVINWQNSFQNVLTGDNVIFRNFAYIDATNRNRRSFIRRLRETYQNFSPDEGAN
jgi:hypothetical protein